MDTLPYNPEAVWISHSALEEYYRCPKSYFYRNIYTNSNGSRVTLADPNLTLGIIVDETVKYFFKKQLEGKNPTLSDLHWYLDFKWKLRSGKAGGFTTDLEENEYKERAQKFLKTFYDNIDRLALHAEVPSFLQVRLFDEGDVRLCGTPDLIQTLPDGTLHIIDLKTSQKENTFESLQLPIYTLLVEQTYGKKVSKTSYWYLNLDNQPKEVQVNPKDYLEEIKFKTQPILKARMDKDFKCLKSVDGCFKCSDYEFIKRGIAQVVGKDRNRVVYFVDKTKSLEPIFSDDLPF